MSTRGIPAWWIETAQLLDIADGLLVPDSLLWLTSHRLVAQLEKLGHTLVINSAA